MINYNNIIQKLIAFRDERDWKQFHTPENLAKSIAIESGELLECFQWNTNENNLNSIKEELADVLIYCFYLANYYHLDIEKIINEKIEFNNLKYPVDKSKSNCLKYNKL